MRRRLVRPAAVVRALSQLIINPALAQPACNRFYLESWPYCPDSGANVEDQRLASVYYIHAV